MSKQAAEAAQAEAVPARTVLGHPFGEGGHHVNQIFGENPGLYKLAGMAGHNGIDFWAFEGTEVLAAADGVVAFAGEGADCDYMGRYAGRCVVIDHGDIMSGYAHLVKPLVEEGQEVKRGDVIALSGLTGATSGPHLHFEAIAKPLRIDNGYFGRVCPGAYSLTLLYSPDVDDIQYSCVAARTQGVTCE
jgi:murein DD-endopeptidase MepM/ murein hydrolase activator NlpD